MRWALLLCASACYGEIPELWSPPSSFPPTLRDVASRLPANTAAREPDLITYAHEANHFLCKGKPGYHCIYIGNGKRWEIPTPPLTTEEVFAAIPKDLRGTTLYRTYLSQGRSEYWARQPLMILDEWRAYTVGSHTRQELGQVTREETVRHMETFTVYARVLCDLAEEVEGYDTAELLAFCRWNLAECRKVRGFRTAVGF
jgi:hypothetical protein